MFDCSFYELEVREVQCQLHEPHTPLTRSIVVQGIHYPLKRYSARYPSHPSKPKCELSQSTADIDKKVIKKRRDNAKSTNFRRVADQNG